MSFGGIVSSDVACGLKNLFMEMCVVMVWACGGGCESSGNLVDLVVERCSDEFGPGLMGYNSSLRGICENSRGQIRDGKWTMVPRDAEEMEEVRSEVCH